MIALLNLDPTSLRYVLAALQVRGDRYRAQYRRIPAGARQLEAVAARALEGHDGSPFAPDNPGADDDLVRAAYTVTEVAELLAVSDSTVKRLLAGGDLGSVQVGTARRVLATQLDAYLDHLAQQEDAA